MARRPFYYGPKQQYFTSWTKSGSPGPDAGFIPVTKRPFLNEDGSYDLKAIMKEACRLCRSQKFSVDPKRIDVTSIIIFDRTKLPQNLKWVWSRAKRDRALWEQDMRIAQANR